MRTNTYTRPVLGIQEFRERHPDLKLAVIANRIEASLATVKSWTRAYSPRTPSPVYQERLHALSMDLLKANIRKVGTREYFRTDDDRWIPLSDLPPDHPLAIGANLYGC